jgi:hypothetical protein
MKYIVCLSVKSQSGAGYTFPDREFNTFDEAFSDLSNFVQTGDYRFAEIRKNYTDSVLIMRTIK